MAMASKIKDDNTIFFGKIWNLGTPVTCIAAPPMYEHKSWFSGAIGLVRYLVAIFGSDNVW